VAIDYDQHLRDESDRFLRAIQAADTGQPVPTCPGWTTADLLWHLAEVQHFWVDIVANRRQRPSDAARPERPESFAELERFFTDSHRRLMDALVSTGDEVAVWTWYEPNRTVGFVRRRQVHEALIHRLDAEATAGREPSPSDAELAADGVDEALVCMFSGAPGWARTSADGPVGRLRTTDTNREWLVQLGRFDGTSPDTGTSYTDEPMLNIVASGDSALADHVHHSDHEDPSFDISATASDLMAWIWNRPARGDIVRRGDTAAIELLLAVGVQ
jgi:uncharacterized protein (TIGR03083 family)